MCLYMERWERDTGHTCPAVLGQQEPRLSGYGRSAEPGCAVDFGHRVAGDAGLPVGLGYRCDLATSSHVGCGVLTGSSRTDEMGGFEQVNPG